MLAMIGCVDLDDRGNDLRVIFQFNRQLQADPNHSMAAWTWPTSQSEQSSGSEGGDTSQDQGPLRLQELEEGACHRGGAEPPQHCLLLMAGRRQSLPLRQSLLSANRLGALPAEGGHLSRCLSNCDQFFS